MTDTAQPVIKFRDPRPPHAAYLTVQPADLRYSWAVRRMGTAVFQMYRSDPNVSANLDRILPNEPAMITIERADRNLPWIGFVVDYDAAQNDPVVTFQAADHACRLAAPTGARTRKNTNWRAASGVIIRNEMQAMEDRAEPAPFLKYDSVGFGPGANFEVRADYALDMLEALAQQTNFEWGFASQVSDQAVETRLIWQARLGTDRRNQDIWTEQHHFTKATYSRRYRNGVRATIAVGGSGAFGNRPTAVVSVGGTASDLTRADTIDRRSPFTPIGLGGTRMAMTEQITDPIVLKQQAQQMHEAPENAAERISLSLSEGAVDDMAKFGLGDIRTIRLQTTALGTAMERIVRIVGIQMIPRTGTIEVDTQVLV